MITPMSARTYSNVLNPISTTHPAQKTVPNPNASQQADAVSPAQGEKVTLSTEGKAALQKSQSAYQEIANSSDPEIAVRVYQIPDWLQGTAIQIDPKLGGSGIIQTGNSGKIANADDVTRNEFTKLIREHYESVLNNNGISTLEEHYNGLIVDKANSEKVHQQFKDSVGSDKRLVELMQKIGISLL